MKPTTREIIERIKRFSANNYHPFDIVISKAAGTRVWDIEGNEYLDMHSSYSVHNFGHNHPRLIRVLIEQAHELCVMSRAFNTDVYADFVECLARFCFLDKVLPASGGAEAVETAIKVARKWGYRVKGVKRNKAEIITCDNNFHGRNITIVSGSSVKQYRDGFGPFTPGFKRIPFGDADVLEKAITKNTVAFLVEPIQGEGGINVPPDDYLRKVQLVCSRNNVLFVLDEIQTGLGRTGSKFAFWYECLGPDILILGKALGGGILPVSAVVAKKEIMDVIEPGDHGSTFGGNPLACAVAVEALKVLEEERLAENASHLGHYFMDQLQGIDSPLVKEVRGRGLLVGVELFKNNGREICEALIEKGILCKETKENIIRLAPPLVITKKEIDEALEKIYLVLKKF